MSWKSAILLITLLIPFATFAQVADSTEITYQAADISDSSVVKESKFKKAWLRECGDSTIHQFRAAQLIAPTLLTTSGFLIAYNPYLKQNIDIKLKYALISDGHKRVYVEDYIQYVPIVAVYGLNICGLKGNHGYRDLTNISAASYILAVAMMYSLKYTTNIERPNHANFQSFPSGHTINAFTGAEILRREYKEYPAVGITGYVVATGVGFMRAYNNKHWASDILAGAGIGILSASIAYWLAPYLKF